MQGTGPILLLAASGLMLLPCAAADHAPEDIEQNRRKVETLQSRPEVFERLQHETRFFLSLPSERQHRIIAFDEQLAKLPTTKRHRLERTLERYVNWLDGLDAADRRQIEGATDKKARLAVIKTLRERAWLKREPAAFRAKVAKLSGADRINVIQDRHNKERRDRIHWQVAGRFWNEIRGPLPHHLTDFSADLQNFVKHYLLPRLSPREVSDLHKADGHWPGLPMLLVRLADRHPPALPDVHGPKRFEDLPEEIHKKLFKKKAVPTPRFLKRIDDVGLGRAVSQLAKNRIAGLPNGLPHELWPYGYNCLSKQVKDFIDGKLRPVLNTDEKLALVKAEGDGIWPDYPLKLKELAANHDLRVPWQTLPGPPNLWDRYRVHPYFTPAMPRTMTRTRP